MAATILAAVKSGMPDGVCSVRSGREVWEGWCSGLDEIKTSTEQGLVAGFSGNVRYLTADETVTINRGDVLEIKRAQDDDYIKARVGFRHSSGGAVRLTIAAEFE